MNIFCDSTDACWCVFNMERNLIWIAAFARVKLRFLSCAKVTAPLDVSIVMEWRLTLLLLNYKQKDTQWQGKHRQMMRQFKLSGKCIRTRGENSKNYIRPKWIRSIHKQLKMRIQYWNNCKRCIWKPFFYLLQPHIEADSCCSDKIEKGACE